MTGMYTMTAGRTNKLLAIFFLLFTSINSTAQKQQSVSLAFTDNASAYPFGKFIGFLEEPVHAGFEAGWSHATKKNKHFWYWDLKAGYFYHQYVQNGILLYGDYGYRYQPFPHFSADISLGAGYFHSIPATAVLKLNDDGEYENGKGIGRPQVIFPLTMGINYDFQWRPGQSGKIFLQYQQRLQVPFIKTYVPVLPYNQIAVGLAIDIHPKH